MKVTIIPIVIGALDTVTKGLLKGLKDLEIRWRMETIQTTTLLRSARIFKRVLATWGDLLSLKLQLKTISKRWCKKLSRFLFNNPTIWIIVLNMKNWEWQLKTNKTIYIYIYIYIYYLFIICLDYVLRTSIDKIRENGFELTKKRRRYPAKTITDADYTDDIAILANTPNQVETLLHSLERAAAGIGLHVNVHKTEYMCYNQTGDISTLDGTPLKLVDKFTYLGSSVE